MVILHVLLFALLQSPTGGVAVAPTTSSSPAQMQTGVGGTSTGTWELPTAAGAGQMHGVLTAPDGTALFAVHAQVLPGGPLPGSGNLRGVLVRLVGPNPGPVAELVGHWRVDPNAPDQFVAKFIRPGDPAQSIPPQLIGGMHGRFVDPQGPLPPAGVFHALWHVSP
jgi:hypothetical protein